MFQIGSKLLSEIFNFSLLDEISFPISSSKYLYLPGKNLLSTARVMADVQSNSYGYFVTGFAISPDFPAPGDVSTVRRLDFSNETMSLPGTDYPVAAENAKGVSSSYYGYVAGGYVPTALGRVNTIRRLDFSSETFATPGNNLPSSISSMITFSNSN